MDIGYSLQRMQETAAKQAYAPDVLRNVPLSTTLKEKRKYHQEQIERIDSALQVLETNKDVEKLIYLLNEVH